VEDLERAEDVERSNPSNSTTWIRMIATSVVSV